MPDTPAREAESLVLDEFGETLAAFQMSDEAIPNGLPASRLAEIF